jgi:hypothetical protein
MKYSEARDNIQSGDLLVFSHFGCRTWHDFKIQCVRAFTRSEYSHVGIAWNVGGRLMCLEAVMPLVRIYPLSKLGEFYWMPTQRIWTPETEEFALSIVGSEYSQWKAIRSKWDDPHVNDNLWQCCLYAREVLRKSGVPLRDSADTPTKIVKEMQERDFPLHLVQPE